MCIIHINELNLANLAEAYAVRTLSEMVSKYNEREWFNTDEETWPPD